MLADFTCADETGLDSCVSDVEDGEAIDTTSVGGHDFTVTATDAAGHETTVTHSYTVADVTGPTITITSPADGATYTQGQFVDVDFSCTDADLASGVDTCDGDVGGDDPADTTTPGEHTFTVVATDGAGNQSTLTHHYSVTPVHCAGRVVTVVVNLGESPTPGNDIILGTLGGETIDGGGGNDLICAWAASTPSAAAWAPTPSAVATTATPSTAVPADRLYGDAATTPSGETGADTLEGGNGNDTLNGGPQRDTCRGGPQRDSQTACEVRTGVP